MLKRDFCSLESLFFLIQGIIKQHVKVFLKENRNEKKFQNFDENHALSASIALTRVIWHAQQNCTGYRSHVFSVRLQRIFFYFCVLSKIMRPSKLSCLEKCFGITFLHPKTKLVLLKIRMLFLSEVLNSQTDDILDGNFPEAFTCVVDVFFKHIL